MNEQLLTDIDAAIKTNGNGAITGPVLNNLLKRIVNASGSSIGGAEFPAHISLTSGDVGKLVMNVDGEARVSTRIPSVLGQTGQWAVEPAFPMAPEQATITILLPSSYTPNDGDMFFINTNNIFYFKTIAMASNEIEIDGSHAILASNMADALTSASEFKLLSNTAVSGGTEFKLAVNYGNTTIGSGSNTFFSFNSATPVQQTGSTIGVNNDYPANDVGVFSMQAYNINMSSSLYLNNVLAQIPANGNMIGGVYWPLNRNEYMQAFVTALSNMVGFAFLVAIEQYGPSSSDTHIVITEIQIPKSYGTTIDVPNLSSTSSVNTQIMVSRETIPAYVKYPILGVLLSAADGVAKIQGGSTLKLKLSPESGGVVFDEGFPAAWFDRLLVGHDDGTVTTVEDDDEDATQKYLVPAGVFQALTEAEPGGYVLVRKFATMPSGQLMY